MLNIYLKKKKNHSVCIDIVFRQTRQISIKEFQSVFSRPLEHQLLLFSSREFQALWVAR